MPWGSQPRTSESRFPRQLELAASGTVTITIPHVCMPPVVRVNPKQSSYHDGSAMSCCAGSVMADPWRWPHGSLTAQKEGSLRSWPGPVPLSPMVDRLAQVVGGTQRNLQVVLPPPVATSESESESESGWAVTVTARRLCRGVRYFQASLRWRVLCQASSCSHPGSSTACFQRVHDLNCVR
jgi:hypothetical protein